MVIPVTEEFIAEADDGVQTIRVCRLDKNMRMYYTPKPGAESVFLGEISERATKLLIQACNDYRFKRDLQD